MVTKRGRKSQAELDMDVLRRPLKAAPTVAPPDTLSTAACLIFEEAVKGMPKGWFQKHDVPILASYAAAVATSRVLDALVAKFEEKPTASDDDVLRTLDRLTKLRQREVTTAVACARSLRIAKSARTRPEMADRRMKQGGIGLTHLQLADLQGEEPEQPWDGSRNTWD